jgi:4-deoxy-L-threo-5-hexosulose-uronate ketol-isomerase
METRNSTHPLDVKNYQTERLRNEFLIKSLFVNDHIETVYSQNDRIITGGICPVNQLALEAGKELRADFFLQRREMGIINIGGDGVITADGKDYQIKTHDCIYIGMGVKDLKFSSLDKDHAAKFYFNSTPAHKNYPIEISAIEKAVATKLGSKNECNERTIYKFVHPDGIKSCQLVMGMTMLEQGSVWNTMPCHTHDRRMEVYLYFNLGKDGLVFHMMGEPDETRHIVVRNEEAVISPSWSIHSGVGTKNYTFIWGMAGENQTFSDMDAVDTGRLK